MRTLLKIFLTPNIDLSLYPIAEGVEEYRVKREILSNLNQQGNSSAALAGNGGCGWLAADQEKQQ